VGLWCVKVDRKRAAFLVILCGVIAAGSAFAVIYRPSIAPIAKPDARLFSVDVIHPFADSLTDAEVAAYLRARYSSRAAWPKLTSAAAAARKQVVTAEMSMIGDPSRTHMMSLDQPIQTRR
jgi:hypothetical protein